jgi:hypothetical protein
MALGLQGSTYSYLTLNQIPEMMSELIRPARDVTISILDSWSGDLGFRIPEADDDESESYKLLAQVVHMKRPDPKKQEKVYKLNGTSKLAAPRPYNITDGNGRIILFRYNIRVNSPALYYNMNN